MFKFAAGVLTGIAYMGVQLVRHYERNGDLSKVEESIVRGQQRAKALEDERAINALREQLYGPGGQSRYL